MPTRRRADRHIQLHITLSPPIEFYRTRIRSRDPYCIVSGHLVVGGDLTRFKAAHIFARAYEIDYTYLASVIPI
ncbi:hypothetical protein PILCRDRAFT_818742 [Piloderma croceum F 1598]|uniref:HNH nuclease domain-containing protein n=1 Tax=Piloderma croceum (strain F 1598) TaxID=765440 RepID=A0A0C3FIZ2_PILCF|nr:hypothetical protein PILCRDRAFT_818742 [Piloderma croceum F 1598]